MPNSAASAEPLDVAHGNVDSVWPIDDDAALRRFIAQKQSFRNINLQIDMLCQNNVTILLVRPSLMLIVRV